MQDEPRSACLEAVTARNTPSTKTIVFPFLDAETVSSALKTQPDAGGTEAGDLEALSNQFGNHFHAALDRLLQIIVTVGQLLALELCAIALDNRDGAVEAISGMASLHRDVQWSLLELIRWSLRSLECCT